MGPVVAGNIPTATCWSSKSSRACSTAAFGSNRWRKVFSYMRNHLGEDVASANLVIDGSNSVLVNTGEELIDLLQNGQGVLNVLPLAGVKDEVDARIVSLYPDMADVVIDVPQAAGDA